MHVIDSPTCPKNGFTIIEILVVLAIISIFIGFTLNRFTGQSSEKIHKANVDSTVDFITIAKAKASSGESNTCPQTTESLYQILVQLKTSTTLSMNYICTPTFSVADPLNLPTPFLVQQSRVTNTSIMTTSDLANPIIATFTRKGVTMTGSDLQISTSDKTPYNTCIRVCDTGSIVQTQYTCGSAQGIAWSATACN
ncbi:MAG: type II secretion system protein [Candidatus Roizmanbacteria bacterium]